MASLSDNEAIEHKSVCSNSGLGFQDNNNGEDQAQRGSQKGNKTAEGGGDADDFDTWIKSSQLLKPDDQLELTEAELGEEVSKVLTPTNTNVIDNLVVYSFKEGAFILIPPAGDTVTLLKYEGNSLHLDSEEAIQQIEESEEIGYPLPAPRYSVTEIEHIRKTRTDSTAAAAADAGQGAAGDGDAEDEDEGGELEDEVEGEADEEGEEGGEGVEEKDDADATAEAAAAPSGGKKRKLINQFNFCERAALTFNNPTRSVDTQTIPPPRSQFGSYALQWIIYDSYAKDFEEQQKLKEKDHDKKTHRKTETSAKQQHSRLQLAEEINMKYLKCWQILERIINQNIYKDIAHDYRYWEDPADEYREVEGNLLPLWKFSYERTKKMCVTDMMFNPHYYDLFAVCFGSYDFLKQNDEGSVCLFTCKNPSYPDYIFMTNSGVMCCDIHPTYPFLLAIGLYDGNVAVYDLKSNTKEPLYMTEGVNAKHADSVTEIKWGPNMADGEINFYSVSSDGGALNYVLLQNKLMVTTTITMYLPNATVVGPDGTELHMKICASSLQFHPQDKEIFLVGSEEGFIYKCSIAYNSKYLMIYRGHNLSVYRIDFNRFNSNIFISCSADWRVKVWEDMRPDPLFIFDLGSAVGDVKWAPYSSTVFAAVTNEGKVYVFDINVNRYQPICVQAIVPKRKFKLTRLSFNEKLPFIIVGDDKGSITSLKLSPNLRLMVKPPKKQLYLDQTTLQIQKLEKLLSLVRELGDDIDVVETTTTAPS